jgi:hypothetical protein
MSSIRNRLVVALLPVLACATVAAGIIEQRHVKEPIAAAAGVAMPVGPVFRDASVPAASAVFEGTGYVAYEDIATF